MCLLTRGESVGIRVNFIEKKKEIDDVLLWLEIILL